MTEQVQADGDAGVVVNQSWKISKQCCRGERSCQRHVDYGVKAADYTPVGAALLWTLEQNLGLR